jgi:hypothetical protein
VTLTQETSLPAKAVIGQMLRVQEVLYFEYDAKPLQGNGVRAARSSGVRAQLAHSTWTFTDSAEIADFSFLAVVPRRGVFTRLIIPPVL